MTESGRIYVIDREENSRNMKSRTNNESKAQSTSEDHREQGANRIGEDSNKGDQKNIEEEEVRMVMALLTV